MRRSGVCRALSAVGAALALAAAWGCAGDSRPFRPESTLLAERGAYYKALAQNASDPVRRLADRIAREYREEPEAGPPTLDVLMLSGGGDYGAFGAGFLNGWGEVPAGDMERPTFDVVTGVSTGALIAPFAFVGGRESFDRLEALYRNPKPDWVLGRNLLAFLVREKPYFDTSGLERELRDAVNAELIARMGDGAREGRLLAVGATNLDYGGQSAFVLSEMALSHPDRPEAIHRAMLASSAIPIAFPPVEIDGSLYVDGGLTSNILFSTDPESPGSFNNVLRREHPDLPSLRVRYWVIVNNQLVAPPRVVQPRWSSIGGPTVETAIRASTLASLREIYLLSKLYRTAGIEAEFRWVAIPDAWRAPAPGMFEPETMRDLANLGRRLGADPASWKTRPLE